MRTRHALLALTLGLTISGCASLEEMAGDFGNFADAVMDEAMAENSGDAPDLGKAVDRVAADRIDQNAEALAELESEMTCPWSDYDEFFQAQLDQFVAHSRRAPATSASGRAAQRLEDEAIGRQLRVCGDLTDRLTSGEEMYERHPDRAARLMALVARYDEEMQEFRADVLPKFQRWATRMRRVR